MSLHVVREDGSLSTLRLVALGAVIYYLSKVIYRVWFHPLAKFPGPRLAAATSLYEAYYEVLHKGGAQFAPKIRELHAKYGPIVRINPSEISVNDAAFHDKLYAPQPAIRDRHPNFSSFLGTTKGSFSSPDHFLHKSRRTAYMQFFSSANVMASETVAAKKVNHLCDILSSRRDEKPNFRVYFAAIAFDTFYTWAFADSLDLLDNLSFAENINETVELLVTSAPIYRLLPSAMALARKTPTFILRHLSRHVARVFDLSKIVVQSAERFAENNPIPSDKAAQEPTVAGKRGEPETLFSAIRRSQAPDEEKTPFRIAQEGLEMFMASFTPGRTMTLGMYYLLSHPTALESLRAELDYANPNPTEPLTYRKLNTLPYLRAVMKEILRITFPVGSRLPLICHEEIEFNDWRIPAYTPISVNHRTLLLDPNVYPEPNQFKPERWLDKGAQIDERRYNVPFGKGGRSCPSKEYATNLIQLTIATLVQRFEFETIDTIWERDVAVSRESTLTAPAFGSGGIKLNLVGVRKPGQAQLAKQVYNISAQAEDSLTHD